MAILKKKNGLTAMKRQQDRYFCIIVLLIFCALIRVPFIKNEISLKKLNSNTYDLEDSGSTPLWGYSIGNNDDPLVAISSDGNYIVAGRYGKENEDYDAWLFKLDKDGNLIWEKKPNKYNFLL